MADAKRGNLDESGGRVDESAGVRRRGALGARPGSAGTRTSPTRSREVPASARSEPLRDEGALVIGYETFSRYVGEALPIDAAVGGSKGNEERSDADDRG